MKAATKKPEPVKPIVETLASEAPTGKVSGSFAAPAPKPKDKREPVVGRAVLVSRNGQTFIGMYRITKDTPDGAFYSESVRGAGFSILEGAADAWADIPALKAE